MRGRKPTPFELKVLRGNPGQRQITPEARPERLTRLPQPPPFLLGEARAAWRRTAAVLIEAGVLTRLDLGVLGAYASAYGRWAEASARLQGLAVTDKAWAPLMRMQREAEQAMVKHAVELGLTPASRSRVAVAAPHRAGKFTGLLAGDKPA